MTELCDLIKISFFEDEMLCMKNVYIVFTGALEYFIHTPLRGPADASAFFFFQLFSHIYKNTTRLYN